MLSASIAEVTAVCLLEPLEYSQHSRGSTIFVKDGAGALTIAQPVEARSTTDMPNGIHKLVIGVPHGV